MHGEALLSLAYPLFPAGRSFAALNEKLLAEVQTPAGAGARGRKPSVIARSSEPTAAGTLPVVQTQEGWGIDTTQIEQAFHEAFTMLTKLSEEMKQIKEERCKDKVRQIKQLVGNARQQFRMESGTARGRGQSSENKKSAV